MIQLTPKEIDEGADRPVADAELGSSKAPRSMPAFVTVIPSEPASVL
jgi:hypothetical protein